MHQASVDQGARGLICVDPLIALFLVYPPGNKEDPIQAAGVDRPSGCVEWRLRPTPIGEPAPSANFCSYLKRVAEGQDNSSSWERCTQKLVRPIKFRASEPQVQIVGLGEVAGIASALEP